MQTDADREATGVGASLRPPGMSSAPAAAKHAISRLSVRRMLIDLSSRRWISECEMCHVGQLTAATFATWRRATARGPDRAAMPRTQYTLGKLVGYVVSTKMDKTVRRALAPAVRLRARATSIGARWPTCLAPSRVQVVVQMPYVWMHPKYNHPVRRRTRLFAHDEYELCNDGDLACTALTLPRATTCSQLPDGGAGQTTDVAPAEQI